MNILEYKFTSLYINCNIMNTSFGWRICCFFIGVVGVFLAYLVFFWRIWCFALRTCFLFGVLGVWFGVFGMLSSLKMCRFLIINFAESSLYCVFGGKKYTGWKKIHHRRLCGCGLISGMERSQKSFLGLTQMFIFYLIWKSMAGVFWLHIICETCYLLATLELKFGDAITSHLKTLPTHWLWLTQCDPLAHRGQFCVFF